LGLETYLEFVGMLHSLQYFPCWTSGGGRGAVVVGENPIGDRPGDVAIVSPANNEMVIIGELHIAGGRFCGNNWWKMWSCNPLGVGGFVGWLFFGPGIIKSRPGKSGRRGGGVLLANFFKVGLEFIALCLGNGARPHMTSLVVAANKAFGADVPAGAHGGGFIPLGTIPCAFPCKIMVPNLALFHQEFGDGGEVLDNVLPFNFVGLPFFPSFPLPSFPGVTVVAFVGFLGGGLLKLGGRMTLRELFMTISKTLPKQTRLLLTIKRLPNFWHSPSKCWMQISVAYKNFVGRLPSVAIRPLKMIFMVWMAVAIDFTQ
jgi:hypothetical protein